MSLRKRMTVHRQQIKHPETRMLPLSGHLDVCGGGNFTIFPLYKFSDGTTEQERENKEHKFINKYKPKLNR